MKHELYKDKEHTEQIWPVTKLSAIQVSDTNNTTLKTYLDDTYVRQDQLATIGGYSLLSGGDIGFDNPSNSFTYTPTDGTSSDDWEAEQVSLYIRFTRVSSDRPVSSLLSGNPISYKIDDGEWHTIGVDEFSISSSAASYSFEVQRNHTYTIKCAQISGYLQASSAANYTALNRTRGIYLVYKYVELDKILAVDENLNSYNSDELRAAQLNGTLPTANKFIGILYTLAGQQYLIPFRWWAPRVSYTDSEGTSVTVPNDITVENDGDNENYYKLVYAIQAESRKWSENTSVELEGLTPSTSSSANLDGQNNTGIILTNFDPGNNPNTAYGSHKTYAAPYVARCYIKYKDSLTGEYKKLGGFTYDSTTDSDQQTRYKCTSYLPAISQLTNLVEGLNWHSTLTLLGILGMDAEIASEFLADDDKKNNQDEIEMTFPNLCNGDIWWSSTQYSAGNSRHLSSGTAYYGGKHNSSRVIPVFDLSELGLNSSSSNE